jgi:uncharacterized membrane protein YqjE
MSDNQGGESSSLFAALKNITATLLASGKTRLELLGNEIEEEKLRAIQLVLMAQGMVFCFGVGTLFAVVLLTMIFWDSRILVLGTLTVLFLVLGGVFLTLFRRATHRPERVFAASIAELQEDIRQLKAAVGHEPPAN